MMKFKSEWEAKVGQLECTRLKESCICYRRWKKRVPSGNTVLSLLFDSPDAEESRSALLRALEVEMRAVNDTFCGIFDELRVSDLNLLERHVRPPANRVDACVRKLRSLIFCLEGCGRRSTPPCASASRLEAYADINSRTVTKICKRIDKRGTWSQRNNDHDCSTKDGVEGDHPPLQRRSARAWLVRLRASGEFDFISGSKRTALAFMASDGNKGEQDECPVCFDRMQRGSIVITGCGHAFCRACVMCHLGVQGKNGLLHNLSKWAFSRDPEKRKMSCPMCRYTGAFFDKMIEI